MLLTHIRNNASGWAAQQSLRGNHANLHALRSARCLHASGFALGSEKNAAGTSFTEKPSGGISGSFSLTTLKLSLCKKRFRKPIMKQTCAFEIGGEEYFGRELRRGKARGMPIARHTVIVCAENHPVTSMLLSEMRCAEGRRPSAGKTWRIAPAVVTQARAHRSVCG